MDPSQAGEDAKKRLDAGADGLKVYAFSAGMTLPEAVMQALTQEAHTRQKPVFAHPTTEGVLMAALRAGADVIAHPTPQSGPWSESVLSAMKKAGVADSNASSLSLRDAA